jgi:hypothetical protein
VELRLDRAAARDRRRRASYGAGNAASNADGSKEGDRIYTPSPKPLAVTQPTRLKKRTPK